jgi:hypothetical protein
VGFALSIVGAAIGMTVAADGVVRCEAAGTCAPASSVAPTVAGFQAAPVLPERAAEAGSAAEARSFAQEAATLVALATTVVLLAIFAILFSYRQRPGGVRASGR